MSDVDRDWLRWLGRFRYATMKQLAAKFQVSDGTVCNRVRRLEAMGLVVRYAWELGAGSVVLPTADGMRVAMVELPVPQFKRGTVAHELAVVSFGLMWEYHGLNVVTDREIRASLSPSRPLTDEIQDAADVSGIEPGSRPLFAVWQGAPGTAYVARQALATGGVDPLVARALGLGMAHEPGNGRGTKIQWHVPDLVISRFPRGGRSQTVAVEIELTAKQPSEYRRILAAYDNPAGGGGVVASPFGGYGQVRYYVSTPALQKTILGVASGMVLTTSVSVELVSEIDLPAAPPNLILRPRHGSSLTAQQANAARARALNAAARIEAAGRRPS